MSLSSHKRKAHPYYSLMAVFGYSMLKVHTQCCHLSPNSQSPVEKITIRGWIVRRKKQSDCEIVPLRMFHVVTEFLLGGKLALHSETKALIRREPEGTVHMSIYNTMLAQIAPTPFILLDWLGCSFCCRLYLPPCSSRSLSARRRGSLSFLIFCHRGICLISTSSHAPPLPHLSINPTTPLLQTKPWSVDHGRWKGLGE